MALSNPTTPILVSLTGNDIIVVIETTNSVQDFYALFVQLEESDREPSETWSTLGPELRVTVDSNNRSEFKIQDILKKEFDTHITSPSVVLVKKLDGYVRKYRYKYYERYGVDQTKFLEATSSAFYAIQGGIGHLTEKLYNDGSSWWEKLQSEKFFLTDMPQNKITNSVLGTLNREKLFFYNYMISGFELWIKLYYTDKDTKIVKLQDIAYDQHEIYEIEASYLNLAVNEPTLYAYEIWLSSGAAGGETESRFYTINNVYYRNQKYFLYNNKYQISENRLFTGEHKEESVYDKSNALNLSTKEISEYDINEEIPRLSSTGFINKEWLQHLREFYLALKKYEIVNYVLTDSYNLVPILFDSKKLPLPGSEDNLFNQMIKYRFAFSSNFNDNILFISIILTPPINNPVGVTPAYGATGVVKFSTATIKLEGVCFPGRGNIILQRTIGGVIDQTLEAKECIFIRDEDNDSTEIRFVIYNTEISTQYDLVIDPDAIVNENGLNFYFNTALPRKFTMGITSDVVDFTATTIHTDPLNTKIAITRTMDSNDARNSITIVKLFRAISDKTLPQYEAQPWDNILIDNTIIDGSGNSIDLDDYYAAEITVTDYGYGNVLSSKEETILISPFTVEFTNVQNLIIVTRFNEDVLFYVLKDGNIDEYNALSGVNTFIDEDGETYSSLIIGGADIEEMNILSLEKGTADNIDFYKNIKLEILSLPNQTSFKLIKNIIAKENIYIGNFSAGGATFETGTIKVDLTSSNNITTLNITHTEIGLNGTNYQLIGLANKIVSNFITLTYNNFTSAMVDYLLNELDVSGAFGGGIDQINITNNAIPTAAGLVSKANLEAKGWNVFVDS